MAEPAPDPAATNPEPEPEPVPPLFLPVGSVRATLALLTLGTLWAAIALGWVRADSMAAEAFRYLQLAGIMVVSYYFAHRHGGRGEPEETRNPPLYLPRGTIRTLIVLGFVGVAAYLLHQHWADLDNLIGRDRLEGTLFLLLGLAFCFGMIFQGVGDRWVKHWFEPGFLAAYGHVRALAALTIVGVFCGGVLAGWSMPGPLNALFLVAVGFYFGSR